MKWLWRKICNFFTWYPRLYKGRRWYTKVMIAFVSMVVGLVVYLGMVDMNFLWLFGDSPGFYSIMHPPQSEASEIYSADGKLIGKFYNENRSPVKYEDISPVFWKALIDTEDERYFSHHGIDYLGLAGAVKDAIVHEARGASTITQQLAKNLFHVRTQYSTGLLGKVPGLRIIVMKSKEWILATKLELVYNKQEILTMYANTVEFGPNVYGIKTAAKVYFKTTPAELTTEQAALLVGMLKATTYYNPVTNPDRSLERRNVVLHNMYQHGDLERTAYDSLRLEPMKLTYTPEAATEGYAPYFKAAVAHHLSDWCKDYGYDLYNSGLKIYTTLDSKMQRYAEQSVKEHMRTLQQSFNAHWGQEVPWRDEKGKVIPHFIEDIAKKLPLYKELEERFPRHPDSIMYYLNKPHTVTLWSYDRGRYEARMSTLDSIRHMVKYLHSGFIAMEPQTGEVKAWVGDIDYNTWNYDKVTAKRQSGSTFKLFVYTEAMNQGLTPCDKRRDEPVVVPVVYGSRDVVEWKPENSGGHFSYDSIPLKDAFARSLNSIAVRLSQEMGIRNIIRTAKDMGVTSELSTHPSMALGSSDVTLYEMATAYSTIANDGKCHKPVLVTRILDRDGKEIYVGNDEQPRALPYKTAYLMQQMLMGGVKNPRGTSRSMTTYISDQMTDIGGKTGTTNNHSDAWFMGVTPKLVVGAWVGGEYRSIHFRTGALGTGGRAALPICGRFLRLVLGDRAYKKYQGRFMIPKGEEVQTEWYDCSITYTRPAESDTLYYHEGDPDYDEPLYDAYGNPVQGIMPYDEYDERDIYRQYGIPSDEPPIEKEERDTRRNDKRPPTEGVEPQEIQYKDL